MRPLFALLAIMSFYGFGCMLLIVSGVMFAQFLISSAEVMHATLRCEQYISITLCVTASGAPEGTGPGPLRAGYHVGVRLRGLHTPAGRAGRSVWIRREYTAEAEDRYCLLLAV